MVLYFSQLSKFENGAKDFSFAPEFVNITGKNQLNIDMLSILLE
jgi:hypothetical protein